MEIEKGVSVGGFLLKKTEFQGKEFALAEQVEKIKTNLAAQERNLVADFEQKKNQLWKQARENFLSPEASEDSISSALESQKVVYLEQLNEKSEVIESLKTELENKKNIFEEYKSEQTNVLASYQA